MNVTAKKNIFIYGIYRKTGTVFTLQDKAHFSKLSMQEGSHSDEFEGKKHRLELASDIEKEVVKIKQEDLIAESIKKEIIEEKEVVSKKQEDFKPKKKGFFK